MASQRPGMKQFTENVLTKLNGDARVSPTRSASASNTACLLMQTQT
jgi:hypothetical protein